MDWSKVIEALEESGLTQQQIAEHCGCSQPYISQLGRGIRSGPGFEVGTALKSLYDSRRKAGSIPRNHSVQAVA